MSVDAATPAFHDADPAGCADFLRGYPVPGRLKLDARRRGPDCNGGGARG